MGVRVGIVGIGLLALAALSLPAFDQPPGYDAWIWLDWGRDLAHLGLDTDPGHTGVAWKPLPALLAAPLSAFGDAAPELWIVLVRFCALASLVLAFRVGTRIAGRLAGAVAVLALLALPGYWAVVARADAEPVLAALALAAVDLHLGGRRGLAFAAILAAGLIRPEVWPFLALYGALLWVRSPAARPALLAGLAAAPALWFGLDWLASGDVLTGPGTARGAREHVSISDGLENAAEALAAPIWVLVAVAVVADPLITKGARWRRWADSPTVLLVVVALVWLAEIVVLAALGYIGGERFAIGPACLLAPVVGVGAARALEPFTGRWRIVAAAVLAVLAIPLAVRQWELTDGHLDYLNGAESDALSDVIERSGGREELLACPGRIQIEDTRLLARLVYELETDPARVAPLSPLAPPSPRHGPQVIFARHGGLVEHRLGGTGEVGFAAVVEQAANPHWSVYFVACEGEK